LYIRVRPAPAKPGEGRSERHLEITHSASSYWLAVLIGVAPEAFDRAATAESPVSAAGIVSRIVAGSLLSALTAVWINAT
jgi:hypothetical protein